MGSLRRIGFLLYITQTHGIARRYFVVNGFDGALTMLGLLMGFYASGGVSSQLAVSACLGAAIALGASGLSSAYISELAERRKALRELEHAMIARLQDSAHGEAARWVPIMIAVINGLSPLSIALIVMAPLWLDIAGMALPTDPLVVAIMVGFVSVFLLGAFLGTISHAFWVWTGVRAVFIAAATSALIWLLS